MPGKKKKFIDKKNSVTFYLGHRSQKDPLVADETAPQRVLIPVDQLPSTSGGVRQVDKNEKDKKESAAKRKEELTKYGIYFDDEYDYLQHLKDSKEISNIEWDICERIYAPQPKDPGPSQGSSKEVKLKLPSSVFQSEYEEDIGLLNKAAPSFGPRPDYDPDVVAALDDDFDFDDPDNELEDNFIKMATGEGESSGVSNAMELSCEEDEDYEDYSGTDEGETDDSLGSLEGPKRAFAREETRSNFTNYSMSSSVVRRNKQLCLIDDRFEKMFENYEDTEIGALDLDEIEGHVKPDSELLIQYAKEFEKDANDEANLNDKINQMALNQEETSDVELSESDEEEQKEKWDCESILSTYSTTKNRPRLIKEISTRNKIKVDAKTGMPIGVLGKGLTKAGLQQLNQEFEESHPTYDSKTVYSSLTDRSKNETPEQRMMRKKLLKEYRRERRLERKANTEAFKEEKKRQVKVRLNVKSNVQGLKL